MQKANPPHKTKKRTITIARRIVQTIALVLFAIPLLAAGWNAFGLNSNTYVEDKLVTPASQFLFGSFSSSSVFGIQVVDPFAALEVLAASKTFSLDLLLGILPVIVVYGIIRGRAFCGWVCPVNFLLEGINWLREKLNIKVNENVNIHRHTKMAVALGVLLLSAILSVPVFELMSPVGAINKLIVFGSTSGVVVLFAIIIAELFWAKRIWCRCFCPLGGFYEAIGRIGFLNVHINHSKCTHCNACKNACLCTPEILDKPLQNKTCAVTSGDCMACGKCIEACPTSALKFKLGHGRKVEGDSSFTKSHFQQNYPS